MDSTEIIEAFKKRLTKIQKEIKQKSEEIEKLGILKISSRLKKKKEIKKLRILENYIEEKLKKPYMIGLDEKELYKFEKMLEEYFDNKYDLKLCCECGAYVTGFTISENDLLDEILRLENETKKRGR